MYFAIKVIIQFSLTKNKKSYTINATNWGSGILKIFNVALQIEGLESLKKNETYVLVSNHSSMFDIPILFKTFGGFNFIIIYKKELEKIPIFGSSLRHSPFVSINREDPRNAMGSIQTTLEQMSDNDCPIVFPEGTRSEDGKLQSFKRGAFLLASKSKKPIVPIAIIGSSDILPKGSFHVKGNSRVKVIINNPVENEKELDRISEKQLMSDVFNKIKSTIEENS
jgi:1-acyl-sn-glycerol-3-phosphate acyltransferase